MRTTDFVTDMRVAAGVILTAMDRLHALRKEWDALDYGTTLPPEAFAEENADVTADELASVFVTEDALESLLSSGHYSNLYAVRL